MQERDDQDKFNVFIARQPIFDSQKKLYGYELLFRTGTSNGFPDIDGDIATTSLLSSTFFTIGIEKMAAGKLAFINFTEELIVRRIPQLFPNERLVVELLEDVNPVSEVMASCRELKEGGYLFALDDFVYAPQFDELLTLADIVKIDFRLTPMNTIKEAVSKLKPFSCRLLAEKVETYQEFEQALALGFDYFQGYFFAKPEVLQNRELSPSQLTTLQLLGEMSRPDWEFDIQVLEKYVAQDISITYKLLNYINSAHFGRLQPISSIAQAISFLGEQSFRMFVSLIATSQLAKNKPEELFKSAITRAKLLELVGSECGRDSGEMFLLGLFSLLDAMLDRNLAAILGKMPLSPGINSALCEKSGELYPYLRLVETFEQGNWVKFQLTLKKIGLGEEKMNDFYQEAISWSNAFAASEK